MQTLEAIISFFVFMIFTSYVLLQLEDYSGIDDSLYRYQLANDVWRTLYLQGYFMNLNSMSELDQPLQEIRDSTGLCVYISGQQATAPSIRGEDCAADEKPLSKVHHVLLINGMPRQVTLSVYPSKY